MTTRGGDFALLADKVTVMGLTIDTCRHNAEGGAVSAAGDLVIAPPQVAVTGAKLLGEGIDAALDIATQVANGEPEILQLCAACAVWCFDAGAQITITNSTLKAHGDWADVGPAAVWAHTLADNGRLSREGPVADDWTLLGQADTGLELAVKLPSALAAGAADVIVQADAQTDLSVNRMVAPMALWRRFRTCRRWCASQTARCRERAMRVFWFCPLRPKSWR